MIWYKCRPTERQKVYITKFTKIVVNFAKELGYKQIFAQANVKNIGSNKILQNNGFKTYFNDLYPTRDNTNIYVLNLNYHKSKLSDKIN